jgi:hypothetical protein
MIRTDRFPLPVQVFLGKKPSKIFRELTEFSCSLRLYFLPPGNCHLIHHPGNQVPGQAGLKPFFYQQLYTGNG